MPLDIGDLSLGIVADMDPIERALGRDLGAVLDRADGRLIGFGNTAFDRVPVGARQAVDDVDAQFERMVRETEASGEEAGRGLTTGLKAGAAGLAAVAAGLGAVAGAGLAEGIGREVTTDRLAAALGGGERAAARYGEVAGNVYANNFGDSMADVAAAVEAVASTVDGIGRGQGLQDLTETAMNFVDVLGLDLPRSVQVAQQLVTNGLAKDTTNAFDLMTAGMKGVPAALREDVIDALDEYGKDFAALGLSGAESMSLLMRGAEQGAYGIDKTGDALKEFTIRATDLSTGSRASYEAIGLDAEDMANKVLAGGDTAQRATRQIIDGLLDIEDPATRANAAIGLFGTPVEDLSVTKIPDFLEQLQLGQDELGNFEGATKRAGEVLNDNAARDFGAFKRTVETEFLDFLEDKAMPAIDEWADRLSSDLGPEIQNISELWEDIGPVVGDVLGWLANDLLPSVVDGAGTASSAFSDFFDDVGALLDEHPEIAEMGAMLGDGLAWVVEHIFPALGEAIETTLPVIATNLEIALEAAEALAIGFTYVAEYGASAAQMVSDTFGWAFENVLQFAADAFGWIPDDIPIFGSMANDIEDAADGFSDFRRTADDQLEAVIGTVQTWRAEVEREVTPDINTGPAERKIGELITLMAGLRGALNPSRPRGGPANSAGPTSLPDLLAGADPRGDDDSPRRPRPGGGRGDGRPAPRINVENLYAHDYDDFRRQTERLDFEGQDDGVER